VGIIDGGYSWVTAAMVQDVDLPTWKIMLQNWTLKVVWSSSRFTTKSPGPDTNDVWLSDFSFDMLLSSPANAALRFLQLASVCVVSQVVTVLSSSRQRLYMNLVGYATWAPRFEGGIAVYPKTLAFTDVDGTRRTLQPNSIIMYEAEALRFNTANDVRHTTPHSRTNTICHALISSLSLSISCSFRCGYK